MEQHKARRNQLQNEEMFEPIEIDFGYEDAVAFDSDKGTNKFWDYPECLSYLYHFSYFDDC